MSTFRDSNDLIVPTWLRAAVAAAYRYSVNIIVDNFADALVNGIKARHPQFADDEELALIGRDRSTLRGPNESKASYILRLQRWIADQKAAGNAISVLQQTQAYFAPNAPMIRLVNQGGTWCTLGSDGSITFNKTSPKNWNWDGNDSAWSRFWVIIYCSGGIPFSKQAPWGSGRKWGADPNGTIGTTATRADVASIRYIVNKLKSAGGRCDEIIIAFDPASFDPTQPFGAPLPDGTWGRWFNPATGQPARLASARYWKGY